MVSEVTMWTTRLWSLKQKKQNKATGAEEIRRNLDVATSIHCFVILCHILRRFISINLLIETLDRPIFFWSLFTYCLYFMQFSLWFSEKVRKCNRLQPIGSKWNVNHLLYYGVHESKFFSHHLVNICILIKIVLFCLACYVNLYQCDEKRIHAAFQNTTLE